MSVISQKVRSEQARFLLLHSQVPILAGMLYTFGWLLLLGNGVPIGIVSSWLSAQLLLGVIRFLWCRRQIRVQGWHHSPGIILMARYFITCSGCLWAIGILLFYPYQDDSGQIMLLFLVMGLFPFSLLAMQNLSRAFELFFAPVIVSTLISVSDGPPQEWLMVLILLMIFGLLSSSFRRAYQLRLESLTDSIDKEEKADALLLANETIQTRSERDSMTSLYNRAYFDSQLDVLWRFGKRAKTPLCLLLIDVDYFKPYNDNYGHQAGDQILAQFGGILQDTLQHQDDVAARYGGEEFAVLLSNTTAQGGVDIAERIRSALEQAGIRHEYSNVSGSLTCTIGIGCLVPGPDGDASALISKADDALYQGKKQGRNQVVLAPRGA